MASLLPAVPITVVVGGAHAHVLALRHATPRRDAIVSSNRLPYPLEPFGSTVVQPSITVEVDIGHRTPGCPCCALRLDIVDGVLRSVLRTRRPERVFLVADDAEDVATITYTLLSDADLARHVRLDGVIVAIDAVATATRVAAGSGLGLQSEVEALAIADVIVVNRTNHITSDAFGRLVLAMRPINRIGRIVVSDAIGDISLDAWHGAPTIDERSQQSSGVPSTGWRAGTVQTVVLRQHRPLDSDAVDEWISELVTTNARRMLRFQGALSIAGSDTRVCCHGVRSYAMSHSEKDDPVATRHDESLVVVIGSGLDVEALDQTFASTQSR